MNLFLLPIVFVAGILTTVSPCVLPILPIVLSSGLDGDKKRVNGLIFGLILSFSLTVLLLSSFVSALNLSSDFTRNLAVILLLIIGFSVLFPVWEKLQVKLEVLMQGRFQTKQRSGFWGGFGTGLGLGVVWTPCVGPIVATVSTLAALNEFSLFTALLVILYSLGVALPLWFIARNGQKATNQFKVFKTNPKLVKQIFGLIIIATAIFIYTGAERRFQSWVLDNLPEKWANLATTFEDKFNINDDLKDLKNTSIKPKKGKAAMQTYKVDPDSIKQGCLGGKDCIPSIDDPIFESAQEASKWLDAEDRIFGVNHNGIQRAYPQRIMNWHEIVNDEFGQDPVAVTFCPLCGTAVSFIRKVNGRTVEFGVSGKLYNSDLIMYDRFEESYWQQATGEAIVGPAAARDESLEWVSTTTTTWAQWLEKYPNTQVLSLDTGFRRNYAQYPYGTYEENDTLLFGVENSDATLHPKEVVYGILVDGQAKAYTEKALNKTPSFTDTIDAIEIDVNKSESGETTFINVETGEEYISLRGFWFAWAAFNPETLLYK